jgi:TolB protein
MRPDGSHQRPIVRASSDIVKLSWSPDGEWIAYEIRTQEGVCSQLYVVRADGTHVRRLKHDRWCYSDPAWSPDGGRIAFSRSGHGGFTSVWLMNVDGSDLRQLTHGVKVDTNPSWSPDGTTIAFSRDRLLGGLPSIWLMDADGTNQHELRTASAACEQSTEPDWSPEGHWIAFTRDCNTLGPADDPMAERYWSDVFVVRPDGTDLRRLTNAALPRAGTNGSPAWSSDGKRIVFASDRARSDLRDVYVMNADGTGQKRLTRRAGESVASRPHSPDWGPRR